MVTYVFGRFCFMPREEQLLLDGRPIPLTHKAMGTLQVLVANHGHLVEKSEIIDVVWKGAPIEEWNLAVTIHMIRKALGDTRRSPQFIETVTKRGYRFIALTTEMDVSSFNGFE